MNDFFELSGLEEEYLRRALESGMRVRYLKELFLWAQGDLQALLPHATLVCVHADENGKVLRIDCLASTKQTQDQFQHLCDPESGFVVRIARYCRSQRRYPCLLGVPGADVQPQLFSGTTGNDEGPPILSRFQSEMMRHGLRNFLAHGVDRVAGGVTFFSFFSLPDGLGARQAYFADLLLPSLHLAYLRVLAAGERDQGAVAKGADTLLTKREIEILHWVTQGKSREEIGAVLAISPVTVKNHMHKIYRKLNVQNRVQAVMRGHALGLTARFTS